MCIVHLCASKLGSIQGPPRIRKFWRGAFSWCRLGVVTGWVSPPAQMQPVLFGVRVREFGGAGGVLQRLLASVPESTPGNIRILSLTSHTVFTDSKSI